MLSLENIKLAYGAKILFAESSVQLYKGQKIGLVGQNGCGKTSLFKLILNQVQADGGECKISNNCLIGYVEQEIEHPSQLLVDYVVSKHPLITEDHSDLPEFYRIKPDAEKLLINLGFKENELYLPLSSFSGGWQMRANLAKALIIPSDLLLLDEPTNHLDIETVIWLVDWLKKYSGLVLIISHDREFLDDVTTHTLEISGQRLTLYGGNYSTSQQTKYMKLEQHSRLLAKNAKKIEQLQTFVDRYKAKATKAKQAQSKLKMIEKLTVTESMPRDINYSIEFLVPENIVDKVISIHAAKFGYDIKSPLIDNVTIDIFNGDRIGLLGRNGVGKSTLIKGIIEQSTLLSGNVDLNNKVSVGYFAQQTVEMLDGEDTPLEFITRKHSYMNERSIRAYLGQYGFSSTKVNDQIKWFSGGEKARLTIAEIILRKPNILFLDEPTNHLDMQMREELSLSLQNFMGAVVIVSHDKFLLQSVANEFYLINNQQLSKFDGDLEEYHKFLVEGISISSTPKSSAAGNHLDKNDSKTLPSSDNRKGRYQQLKSGAKNGRQQQEKELAVVTQKISLLSEEIKAISKQIEGFGIVDASRQDEFNALSNNYNMLNDELLTYEERWLQLEENINGNHS